MHIFGQMEHIFLLSKQDFGQDSTVDFVSSDISADFKARLAGIGLCPEDSFCVFQAEFSRKPFAARAQIR